MSGPQRARKRFGQHFLVDPEIIRMIVASVAAGPGDTLVEIGPGQGAITTPLARTGATLHAIEFDRDLAAALRLHYADNLRVTIHEADALRFDYASLGRDLRLVGNLPYNISTPLLFRLLEFLDHIRDMHFMLQKEVVDRIAAAPGSKAYGRLTVMLGCRAEVVPLFDVPPDSFSPAPKVMSSVLRIRPREAQVEIADRTLFAALVAQGFSQRRKTLHNALKGHVSDAELSAAGIDPGARAEQVPIEAWARLANELAAGHHDGPPAG
ncbi:MAG: 16S rRNA (adenine(1518)-N(6)/adenine(1519)-N(6))-dimethyltransferase RsmA [Gammaproteobacteria bacterium]|nr:16S rRNA (adenine(1518)-N(6)/adenine(1519)-N(6))-dimethyltransferase RsmA [Gammaproteobacteria bacterium]MDH4255280.1 16S rRNA (adenine(1518)-N(6)/adenine(1519)-N(6))-dimethyltransferase RsmA [Gammaproteobacteria bacterium]MDH5310920.1 16S rRNA (adenine(1518)-N(6)/adenine(1519)-N(6))-dimethyltransferase RsmA [Gammaproteobacteria bacterium]